MIPFNSVDEFERDEIKNEIIMIVDDIKKYDVYDVIARISGLNLLPQNQNKSILLDALITAVLCEKPECYSSKHKMSSGKFRQIIERLNNTDLARAVDPNENVFAQNVMLADNYTVFNGIDATPTYNLQMFIDILFNIPNNLPKEYLYKMGKLMLMVLLMSNEVAQKINLKQSDIISDDGKKVILPDGNKVNAYANFIVFDEQRIKKFLGDYVDLLDDICISFGINDMGTKPNRPFYCRPFIKNEEEHKIILLNISLLSTFAVFKALQIADAFGIKENVIELYNNYVWSNCKKELVELNHYELELKDFNIKLENRSYYKEMITNAYNQQLLLVFFVCDDAFGYTENTMHDYYPDNRHTKIFEERIKYYSEKMQELSIDTEDVFCLVIFNGIGRGVNLKGKDSAILQKELTLNPFELHCVCINEQEEENFLPRYIKAKEKINIPELQMFSELNMLSIYKDNQCSFYFDDDVCMEDSIFFIGPGDGINYIKRALQKEDAILIDSYEIGYKAKVKLQDSARNIYIEDNMLQTQRCALSVRFKNCIIWITSNEIVSLEDLNLYYSIVDMFSFWIAECKEIIENMELFESMYHFNIVLQGERKEFYYPLTEDILEADFVVITGDKADYNVIWRPEDYRQMSCLDNLKEKEFCEKILATLQQNTFEEYDYSEKLNLIFEKPMKKKFFSLDYMMTPYLKPIITKEYRSVRAEDVESLLDMMGKTILATGKWTCGIIPDEERGIVTKSVVTLLYNMLQQEVEQFQPNNFVEAIYFELEKTLYELMLFSIRYASDLACYPEKEDYFMKRYNELNRTSVALKFLIEYVAAKPPKGNKVLGIGKYEYIMAICSLIIEWAYNNDLFFYKIFNTPVEILKSGRIGIKRTEFENLNQYSELYRKEQLYYSSSSDFRKKYSNKQERDYSDELDEAFFSECGYTFSQFSQMIIDMIAYGEKVGDEEIFVVEKSILVDSISQANSLLPQDVIVKILEDISLGEREDFLKLSLPYRNEDTYPWRFNRAYSFNRRPVIARGNEVIWGNRQLYHMLLYVTDLIYDGRLLAKSTALAELIGKISKYRGEAFNQLIVQMLMDFEVFKVESKVKKINKKLIADADKKDLGDIDVLIIDEEMHRIFVTEVKDFNFSRNPYEIQAEYNKMFVDGKKKCFATKHNRRVDWIKTHFEDVKIQYSLDDEHWEIKSLFILSEPLISTQVYHKSINVITKAELSIDRIRSID